MVLGLKNWKVALLLSIIVPTSLLVTFRLTGLLHGALTISETKMLESVKLDIERPDDMTDIKDDVNSTYTDAELVMDCSVFVDDLGGNILSMIVKVNVSVFRGFVSNLNLTFWEDFENSRLDFWSEDYWLTAYSHGENLSISDHVDFRRGSGLKAFLELRGENQSKGVYFDGFMDWWLSSPSNHTHHMELNVELIYFNGSVFKKIIQPLQLTIGPDNNNSPDLADSIQMGTTYSGLYLGVDDDVDFYKVNVPQERAFYVKADVEEEMHPHPDFEVLVYDPHGNFSGSSPHDYHHYLQFDANIGGEWLIETRVHWYYRGFYSLIVDFTTGT